ncbi:MAG: hypothetical protein ACI3XY_00195 [Butyricicoccaceae bacterium]
MRCTKCGRVLQSSENDCPLCGTPAASPQSASDSSSNRQTIQIAAHKKNNPAPAKKGSSPVLDEVFSALSIRFRDSHDSTPTEPPTAETKIIPVKRSKEEPVPSAPVSAAPEEPTEDAAVSNDLSSALLTAVNSILSGQSIPTETSESEPDEVEPPDDFLEEYVPESDKDEPDEVALPKESAMDSVPEPSVEESKAAAEEPENVPIFKTPAELEDAIAAISTSVAVRISGPEEAEPIAEPVAPIAESEEPDTSEDTFEPVDVLPEVCAEIEDSAQPEPVAPAAEPDTAEETGENANVPQEDEADNGVELPTENDLPSVTEEAEPVFLDADPALDALTDSIASAVAAAIDVSVIPHEETASAASDSVSDDTDPLNLPEDVKAILPDAEPPASQESTSFEQTTEEDSMKSVAKKIRKPVRFRLVYTVPALVLAVLLLAGAILFAINSLLTPTKMPEKSDGQQVSDTAKDTDSTPTDDSAAFIGGLYFSL